MKIKRISVLVLILTLIQGKLKLFDEEIDNCVEYVYAPNLDNQFQRDQVLCIECQLGYVVSKNFKSCIEFIYQLSYMQFGNCKRIAQDGQCAEAIRGIELLPNNQFIQSNKLTFSERCAIVSEDYSKCLYPRFGFKLDVNTNQLYQDTEMTFCALFDFDINECVQFQEMFIRIEQTQFGAYLGEDFLNMDKLDITSNTKYWICKDDYIPSTNFEISGYFNQLSIENNNNNGLRGCIFKKVNYVKNCSIQKELNTCTECQFGLAMNENKDQCETVIPNCKVFSKIQNTDMCILCYTCYKLSSQQCTFMLGCEKVSENDPHIITACNRYYRLQNGECIIDDQSLEEENFEKENKSEKDKFRNRQLQRVIQNTYYGNEQLRVLQYRETDYDNSIDTLHPQCLMYGESGCVICEKPSIYYYDQTKKKCVLRNYSMVCQYPAYNLDICLSLECSQQRYSFHFNLMKLVDLKNIETLKFINYLNKKLKYVSSYGIVDKHQFEKIKEIFNTLGVNLQDEWADICKELIQTQYKIKDCLIAENNIFNQCLSCRDQHLIVEEIPGQNFLFTDCVPVVNKKESFFENCKEQDNQGRICVKCEEGYYYNSSNHQCLKKIEECFIHTLNGNCLQCVSGSQLSADTTKCTSLCLIPYYFQSKQYYSWFLDSKNKNQECRKSDIPCAKYTDNVCEECFDGYILDQSHNKNNNICIPDINFPDCKVISQSNQRDKDQNIYLYNDKKCIKCKDDYELKYGRCFCQSNNCKRVYKCTKEQCTKQNSSLFHDNLNIKSNSFVERKDNLYMVKECSIQNCTLCDEFGGCKLCVAGKSFDNQLQSCKDNSTILDIPLLKPIDNGCFEFEENMCSSCKDKLFLMADRKCYRDCPSNYSIGRNDNDSLTCSKCNSDCLNCHLFGSYYHKLNSKQFCLRCADGYYLYQTEGVCDINCPYYVQPFPGGKKCVKSCEDKFVHENICVEQCPVYFMKDSDNKVCAETCNPPLFTQEDSKQCNEFCESGYTPDNNNVCRRCQTINCESCSSQSLDMCYKCSPLYTLINGKCKYLCKNKEFSDDMNNCKSFYLPYCEILGTGSKCDKCLETFNLQSNMCQCPKGQFLSIIDSKCGDCGEGCLSCKDNFGCIQCNTDYKLINYYVSNFDNKSQYYCVKECPIGYYQSQSQEKENQIGQDNKRTKICLKCPQLGCLKCNSSGECLECEPLYELTKQLYSENDSIHNVCRCRKSYADNKEKCFYHCSENSRIVHNPSECCEVANCIQCNKDYNTCERCNGVAPYLFLNTCLYECPIGTYAEPISNICQQCNPLCKSCEGSRNNCSSCILPELMAGKTKSCICGQNQFYFQKVCKKRCPLFSKTENDDMMCTEYCKEIFQFPVFDSLGEFQRCESEFGLPDSQFCYQHLNNINKLISFSLEPEGTLNDLQTEKIFIVITINQTPKDCYMFMLRGKSEELPLKLKFNSDRNYDIFTYTFRLESEVVLSALKEYDIAECDSNFCSFYFDIYLKNILQQTIKLKINFQKQIIIVEGISDKNILMNEKTAIIDISMIEQDSILPYKHYINCSMNSICNSQAILVQPKETVQMLIQTSLPFESAISQFLKIYPLSFYIQSNQTKIPVEQFYYDNSVTSHIKLTFQIDQSVKGQLTCVLRAFNETYYMKGLENMETQSDYQYYIIFKEDIEISKQEISEELTSMDEKIEENETEFDYSLLTYFNTTISITIVLFLLFKIIIIIKNHHSQIQQFEQNEQSLQQSNQQEVQQNAQQDQSKVISIELN